MLKIKTMILIALSLKIIQVSAQTQKILFIGNSITYFNDMPQVFRDIAHEKGDSVDLTMYAPGGTGFQHHSVDNAVFDLFRNQTWDVIVLQPGSNESPAYSQPRATTLSQARILIDSALTYSPCARILFYEISYGVWGNSAQDITTYNNTMDEIRLTAEYLSDSTGLSFAPAGECLRHAWNEDPSVLLWGSTGDIHPNIKGSYLISCAFYAAIFHKPSSGNTVFNGNTVQDATYYQHISDSIVLNHLQQWRIDTTWHQSNFTFTVNDQDLEANNTNSNADSIQWLIDDVFAGSGNQLLSNNLSIGNHELTQIAYFGACSDTLIRSFQINSSLGLSSNQSSSIEWYPNPAREMLFINTEHAEVSIYSLRGDLLISEKDKTEIRIGHLSPGSYLLEVEAPSAEKRQFKLTKE